MNKKRFIQLRSLQIKKLREQVEFLEQQVEDVQWHLDHTVSRYPLEVIQERINTYRQPPLEVLCEINDYPLQDTALAECRGVL